MMETEILDSILLQGSNELSFMFLKIFYRNLINEGAMRQSEFPGDGLIIHFQGFYVGR